MVSISSTLIVAYKPEMKLERKKWPALLFTSEEIIALGSYVFPQTSRLLNKSLCMSTIIEK